MKTVVTVILAALILSCFHNSYDPDDSAYRNPGFEYVDSTTVSEGDTIGADHVTITVAGNRRENIFRIILDKIDTSEWKSQRNGKCRFDIPDLAVGEHRLTIQTCYHPNSCRADSSMVFYRALVPAIDSQSSVQVKVEEGTSCTLFVEATRTPEAVCLKTINPIGPETLL